MCYALPALVEYKQIKKHHSTRDFYEMRRVLQGYSWFHCKCHKNKKMLINSWRERVIHSSKEAWRTHTLAFSNWVIIALVNKYIVYQYFIRKTTSNNTTNIYVKQTLHIHIYQTPYTHMYQTLYIHIRQYIYQIIYTHIDQTHGLHEWFNFK